jgi:hypothetical protein
MKISMAHLRERSTTGEYINFAVFDAKSTSNNNSGLLYQLTQKARANGLKVDQSALAYQENGRIKFFGDQNLVGYLSNNFFNQWTHTLDV